MPAPETDPIGFRREPKIALSLTAAVVALALAVVILQLTYHVPPLTSGWRSSVDPRERNDLGMRGQPIHYDLDDAVILLVGDSQVEARACSFDRMPERRLRAHLNAPGPNSPAGRVEVFSIGVGGYGQDQELLVLREYLENHRADLVILWITPANDVWNNTFPTNQPRHGVPKPTFWLQDDRLLGPSEPLGAIVNASRLRVVSALQRIWSSRLRERRWGRRLPAPYEPRPASQATSAAQNAAQDVPRIDLEGTRHEHLDLEKDGLAIWLTPASDRTRYGIELTRQLMRAMQELVESRGGRFLVLRTTAPGLPPFPDEAVCLLRGREFRTTRRQYDENVEALLEDFPVVAVSVTVESWAVSDEDPHLNEEAVDQVMRDLAAQVRPSLPSPDQGTHR